MILRFDLADLVEPTLAAAFKPLVRSGRLATLTAFATSVHQGSSVALHRFDAVLSEVAFRDGNLDLAVDLAESARSDLPDGSPARRRASRRSPARSHFFKGGLLVGRAIVPGRWRTRDRRSRLSRSCVRPCTRKHLRRAEHAPRRQSTPCATCASRSPVDLAAIHLIRDRASAAGTASGRTRRKPAHRCSAPGATSGRGPASALEPRLHDCRRHSLSGPSTTLHGSGSASSSQTADEFGLEFAMPYANWTLAQIAIGQRRFGEAERALQSIEDTAARTGEQPPLAEREVATSAIASSERRAGGRASTASSPGTSMPLIPSWKAEYLATRALVTHASGDAKSCEKAQSQASMLAARSRCGTGLGRSSEYPPFRSREPQPSDRRPDRDRRSSRDVGPRGLRPAIRPGVR